MKKSVLITILVTAFIFTSQVFETKAAPGDYDPSFGIGGISEHQDMVLFSHQIAMQNDGKILVAGYEPNNNPNPLILRRHNADGSRDMTFGYQGEAVQKISPTDYRYIYAIGVSEIAVQPDGKILVGGSRYNSNGFLGLSVWRFTSAGFLDTTFDTDGRKDIYTPINGEEATLIQTLKITKSKVLGVDKIQILAGYPIYEASNFGIADRSIISRLNLDGSLDTNFGNGGNIKLDGEVYDTATHKSTFSITGNSIYAAGRNKYGTPTVWRFTQNGLLDANFADSGKFAVNVGEFTTRFFTNLLVQPDGKILVSGITSIAQQSDGKFIVGSPTKRYFRDGTVDESYVVDNIHHFTIQKDNKLVQIRGYLDTGGQRGYTISRHLP